MTSNPENTAPVPPPPQDVTPKPKSRMKLIVASAVIIIVVIAVFLGYWFLTGPGKGSGGANSWMFKGAYANFQGQETVTGMNFTITMSIHYEVLDFNSTHAELLTNVTEDMGMGSPFTYNSTSWVPINNTEFNVESGNFTKSYDTTVTLGNLGTRSCTAYEYSVTGGTMTVYVDKTVNFPVKFTMATTGMYSYSFDLTLASTNIPGL